MAKIIRELASLLCYSYIVCLVIYCYGVVIKEENWRGASRVHGEIYSGIKVLPGKLSVRGILSGVCGKAVLKSV